MTERTSKRWWKRPVTLVAGGVLLLVLLLAGAEIWIGIKIRRTIEREAAALTGGICTPVLTSLTARYACAA